MEYKCPSCRRPIITRRNVLCAFCGVRLPKELLFTDEERKKFDDELAQMQQRRKAQSGAATSGYDGGDPGGVDFGSGIDFGGGDSGSC